MSEQFSAGDKVVYEDAYTDETRYAVITQLNGGDAVLRSITEQEAGKSPKRLAKPRIACSFARGEDGNPVCSYHRKPLTQMAVHGDQPNPPGLGHFSAWICPVSSKPIYEAGFNG
jgi:hypothetical protein